MPAKRIVLLDRLSPGLVNWRYRAVLWADVPAGNQAAYADPLAGSAYENIAPAELQAVRNGQVAERLVEYAPASGNPVLATAQAWLQAQWTAWQAQVTAWDGWTDYGRYWDGSAWQAPTGVPACSVWDAAAGQPTFTLLTPVSAFAASKFHLVLYNGAPAATSQRVAVKVRLVVVLPGTAVVTGAVSGPWTLRRREAPTTPPSGAGGMTAVPHDSSLVLPAGVAAWNAPGTPPAGGTLSVFNQFVPQADEAKLSTLDAPTTAAVGSWGGQVVFRDGDVGGGGIVLRPGQACEVQQDATAGTGNGRVLCVFTLG